MPSSHDDSSAAYERALEIVREVAEGGDLADNGFRMIRPELQNVARALLREHGDTLRKLAEE